MSSLLKCIWKNTSTFWFCASLNWSSYEHVKYETFVRRHCNDVLLWLGSVNIRLHVIKVFQTNDHIWFGLKSVKNPMFPFEKYMHCFCIQHLGYCRYGCVMPRHHPLHSHNAARNSRGRTWARRSAGQWSATSRRRRCRSFPSRSGPQNRPAGSETGSRMWHENCIWCSTSNIEHLRLTCAIIPRNAQSRNIFRGTLTKYWQRWHKTGLLKKQEKSLNMSAVKRLIAINHIQNKSLFT